MNTLFWKNHLGDTGTLPVEGPSDVAANVNHNATGSRLAARGAGIMKSGSSGMAPAGMPHLEDVDLKYAWPEPGVAMRAPRFPTMKRVWSWLTKAIIQTRCGRCS